LPIEVYITGIGNFAFLAKNSGKYENFLFTPDKGCRWRRNMYLEPLTMKIGQMVRSVQVQMEVKK